MKRIDTKSKMILSLYMAAICGAVMFAGCGDFIERTYTFGDHTITYDARGGTVEEESEEAEFGTMVTLPSPARRGYEFLGWYSEPSRGGELYGMAGDKYEMGIHDVTMYARWESILPMHTGDSVINGIVCVRVYPGTFTMGSPPPPTDPNHVYDEVQRAVTLTKGFWISKYPVTNRQYYYDVSYPAALAGLEEHPVTNVTWQDADNFAYILGGKLPTEAQWEYAARGGHRNTGANSAYTLYSGGNDPNTLAWYAGNSGGSTQRVGQKSPNGLRVYDMSGNAAEWCRDVYGYYDSTPVTDPFAGNLYGTANGGTTTGRVIRGGGWNSPAQDVRAADRAYAEPSEKRADIGFRVIFEIEDDQSSEP